MRNGQPAVARVWSVGGLRGACRPADDTGLGALAETLQSAVARVEPGRLRARRPCRPRVAGDRTAIEIVDRHGTALGRMAVAAARQVGLRPSDAFSLALTGGVLRHHRGRLRGAIIAAVRAEAPRVVVVEPALEPVAGALLLAFDAAGIPVDAPVVERIADGLRSAVTGWNVR